MRNEKLRKLSRWSAWLVCALALVALTSALSGLDPLRAIRFGEPPMAPGTAVCLLLIGASLALQSRSSHPRLAPALSLGALVIASLTTIEILLGGRRILSGWFGTAAPAAASPVPLQAAVAVAIAGLAVAALSQHRRPGRWSVSAWLANLLVAASVASLMTSAFQPLASSALSFAFGTHATVALLLLGIGVLLARPEEKFVSMLFDVGTTGVLARRLFIGTAITPIVLTVLLLTGVRLELLSITDGVILICGGLILCGAAISLYSTGAAVVIQEQREEAEQARLMLTARLQEQAAQLQETVGRRTRELQEANTSLRLAAESNALLALVAEHTTNGVVIADAVGGTQWVNAAFTRITGYALEHIQGRKLADVLPGPETDPAVVERLRRSLERAEACHLDMLNQSHDRHSFWMALDVQPVRERSGRLVNFIFVVVDITDERAAQQRLFSLNERLALATRSAALGVWEWDPQAKLSQWDARTLEIYGLRPEQHSGRLEDWAAQLHPEDRERVLAAISELIAGGSTFEQQFRIYRANDRSLRHIESRALAQRTAAGGLVRVAGTDRDVTAERDAAQQMALLNERLRLALRSSNFGVWEMDVATRRLLWDDRMCELYGIPRVDFDGTREFWRQRIHPLDREYAFDPVDRAIAGASSSYDIEFRIIHPDGSMRHIEAHGYLQRDASGSPLRLVGLNRDITERKQLEERVKESEALAREVATIARIGGWEYDLDSAQLTWTDGMRLIHEVSADFIPSLESTRSFYPECPMETWPGIFSPGDPSAPDFDQEMRLCTAAGATLWVRILGRTEFGADGRPARVHGIMQDVTARRESETSRRELEVQLFQAQKMETLGTLAGGIAHDFNNLLTGIIGYHELAADSLPEDHPARACLQEAKNASLRARELIEQILTFGRHSSNEGHVALDFVAVLEEGRRFLRSTLPANITIDLRIPPGLPSIMGDATQIHQVLLNLGSNAAHAMRASGGTLTITAAPVENLSDLSLILGGSTAGAYVRLTVADTGHGMDEATRRRIFDPFFTTKNTREGTGLGLAVVHGIVRAHRGAIDVESRPGEGTKFHLYLPAAAGDNEVVPAEVTESPRGSGEFIIVVDDEEIVGTCTKLVLENKGYITAVFRSAEECLTAIGSGAVSCSLLITDQTMPGMQGTELIATLRRQLPTLPAVLMSGYFSKISPVDLDSLDPLELVSKPFTTDELTSAVHRALHPAK